MFRHVSQSGQTQETLVRNIGETSNVSEFARKHFCFSGSEFCFRNNVCTGGGQTWKHLRKHRRRITNVSATMFPSLPRALERYFSYFRTRFEEKFEPQKAIFKSPNVVRLKKYFCKTLYCDAQIQQQNRTMSSFLKWKLYCNKKNELWTLTAAMRVNSRSNGLSTPWEAENW
jgi:hypothetical protein